MLFGIARRVRRHSDGRPDRQVDSRRQRRREPACRLDAERSSRFRDRYFERLRRGASRTRPAERRPARRAATARGARRANGHLSGAPHRELRSRARASSSSTSISGDFSDAARIGDDVVDRNDLFRGRDASARSVRRAAACRRTKLSWSATPCSMSPARVPPARARWRWPPVRQTSSALAAQGPTSCRRPQRHRRVSAAVKSWSADVCTDLKYDDVVGDFADEADERPAPAGAGGEANLL